MKLIDTDELMDNKVWLCGGFVGDDYAQGYMEGLDAVELVIKAMPTIDAMLIIRCKDCNKYGAILCPMVHETLGNGLINYASDDGYCNWASRKDGDDGDANRTNLGNAKQMDLQY